ncbi:MAG: trehalose-6-phosphate synthase [Acidimicrobiia bacterium]
MDRPVVIASNRGPLSFRFDDGRLVARRGAGGLVSGLGPLVAGTDTVWIAAAMSDVDREAARSGVVEAEGLRIGLVDLDPETYRLAYDVVANEVLWFAHHGLWDLVREPNFDRSWAAAWDAYRTLNHAFADAIADAAPPRAAVLVQDYHLCLVAERLRSRRPDVTAVHFSHTPFAPPAWLRPLPTAHARELLEGLAAHHACGFHTRRWADDFAASARDLAGLEPKTFVAPLASDPDDIRAVAASPACVAAAEAIEAEFADVQLIGRVDRIEPAKNLVRGFLAYADLLDRHPELRGRVCFMACAYPSREGVAAYRNHRKDIEALVGEVNGRFATPGWTPIHLDVEDDYPRSVALLRRADVLLVNSIRDGLNLVATEGALVSDRHAVLCLSPEAGAWERLSPAALAAPPFDVAGTSDALHAALTLPADERRRRADRLRELAVARTPEHWLADQLTAAR